MGKGPKKKKKNNWDNKNWIEMQVKKYAGSCFGEADRGLQHMIEMEKGKIPEEKKGQAIVRLFKFLKENGDFLDLGCNSGGICKFMKDKGMNVLGVDLPEVIDKITHDIPKIAMNLEVDFPEGTWDIIYCRETLEHIRNGEDVVLKKIIEALKPDGIAIIACPYSQTDFGKACPEHHRLYKDGELKSLVKRAEGIVIEEFSELTGRSKGVVAKRKKVCQN